YDVYAGIDVYGRGTAYGGGYNTGKALGKIARAGLSAAIFAPGWSMENETPGGGHVVPATAWQTVEADFNNANQLFWAAAAADWPPPRALPPPPLVSAAPAVLAQHRAAGGPSGFPTLVTRFGRGIGAGVWIAGQRVASAGEWPLPPSSTAAVYDLCGQDISPLALGLGGSDGGNRGRKVNARNGGGSSSRSSGGSGGGSNRASGSGGTEGATPLTIRGDAACGWCWVSAFAEYRCAFDGTSCLALAGELAPGVTAAAALFKCGWSLVPGPLAARITFRVAAGCEVSLVLLLLDAGGAVHEVVLRANKAAGPAPAAAVTEVSPRVVGSSGAAAAALARRNFPCSAMSSKRIALRESKAGAVSTYAPAHEETTAAAPAPPAAAAPAPPISMSVPDPALGPWVTRQFVVRDAAMLGQTLQQVKVVASLAGQQPVGVAAAGDTAEAATTAAAAGDNPTPGGAVLVPYSCCLGEVAVGPMVLPGKAFCAVRRLWVYDLDLVPAVSLPAASAATAMAEAAAVTEPAVAVAASGERGGSAYYGGGSSQNAILGLTLAWEMALSTAGSGGSGGSGSASASAAAGPPLHWDVWAFDEVEHAAVLSVAAAAVDRGRHFVAAEAPEASPSWVAGAAEAGRMRWAGRAYGDRLRIAGMPVVLAGGSGGGGSGARPGAVMAAVHRTAAAVPSLSVCFVLQEVDAAGRRQPFHRCP
ncbi:unnamed protein product, partial [Phaeothamnion confervicola]